MLKNFSARPALMATMILSALCASQVHAQRTAQQESMQTAQSDNKLSAADQQMLVKLTQGNMAEVAAGELAQTKSSNPEVLNFAKRMIDDHSKALKDIGELADRKKVELPKATDQKHAEALKKMNTMPSAEFDRQYLAKSGLEDHKATLKLLGDIQSKAKDADLKALAKKMEPTVKGHLEMAQTAHKM